MKKDSKLLEIQEKLDNNFNEYTKKEFDLHLNNYIQIKALLEERDELVKNIENFWGIALMKSNFGFHHSKVDYKKLINYIKVSYEKDFWCRVDIVLHENDFTSVNKLSKKFNVLTEEVDFINFDYKKQCNDTLIQFMKGVEVDLDLFDTIYDIYINAVVFYYD